MPIDHEVLLCKIMYEKVSLMVCALYRPPSTPLNMICEFDIFLIQHVNSTNNFIHLGGFNLPCIDWNTLTVSNLDHAHGEASVDLCFFNYLVQIVNCP